MFKRLRARVEADAQAASETVRQKVEAAFATFPDVQVRIEGDSIVIEAMGLTRRWLNDARLRFASWSRG